MVDEKLNEVNPNETDINKLIDIPLNMLTPEQAEIVISWKAQVEFERMEHQKVFEQMQEESNARNEILSKQADEALETLQELKKRALAFYEQQ